jgi:HEAT repeat protein
VEQLSALGEAGVERLIRLSLESPMSIREAAIKSLAKLGSLRAVEPLQRLAADPASPVRSAATWALVELMAFDPARDWVAARAVEELGQPAGAFLIGALTHKDRNVRYRAAAILGRMAERRALNALTQLLSDTDALVRRHATVALGFIRDAAAAPSLIRAMSDRDKVVRENAIWALGMMRAESAVEAISKSLSSDERALRFRAVNALAEIGGDAAIQAIKSVIADLDPVISEAARNALRRLSAR